MKRLAILASICILAATVVRAADSSSYDSDDAPEYVIKAGFIYNFARFIEWPDTTFSRADSPITIGIIGNDPYGEALGDVLHGKKVNGHGFVIRRVKRGDDLKDCQILLIGTSEATHLDDLLQSVSSRPVLTIGESPGFAEHGGIINLVVEANKVRFEVNVKAAQKAELNVSSRLLSLARIVH